MRYVHPVRAGRYQRVASSLAKRGIRVDCHDRDGFDFALRVHHPISNDWFMVQNLGSKWFLRGNRTFGEVQIEKNNECEVVADVVFTLCRGSNIDLVSDPRVKEISETASLNEWRRIQQEEWERFGWSKLDKSRADRLLDRFFYWYEMSVSLPVGSVETTSSASWTVRDAQFATDEELDDLERELTLLTLKAFRKHVSIGATIYAYDVQHGTFEFDPHAPISNSTRNQWAVPILPVENSYYFFSDDFRTGILSDYPANTITVFGEDLVKTISSKPPMLLRCPIRHVRWSQREWLARAPFWESLGWRRTSDRVTDLAKSLFYDRFYGYDDCHDYEPSITWNLRKFFEADPRKAIEVELDLLKKAFDIIQSSIARRGVTWYATQDCNPTCIFDPLPVMKADNCDHWAVPIIPRVANSRLMSSDGTEAVLSNNRRSTITICGEDVINGFSRDLPLLFLDLVE